MKNYLATAVKFKLRLMLKILKNYCDAIVQFAKEKVQLCL